VVSGSALKHTTTISHGEFARLSRNGHCILQHTATHCNTLQHTRCNTLQHAAICCNTVQHTLQLTAFARVTAPCNTLQHTATYCNTHAATRCNTLQHTSTHTTFTRATVKDCNIFTLTKTKNLTLTQKYNLTLTSQRH